MAAQQREGHRVVTDYTQGVSENSFVKVYVRARPPEDEHDNANELFDLGDGEGADGGGAGGAGGGGAPPPTDSGKKITVKEWKKREAIQNGTEDENQQWGGVGEHAFAFDTVFWTGSKQEEVFDVACRPQVEHVLQGYNACAFAYGQTGSGKTYTMFGEPGAVRGAIPRAVEHLFHRVDAIRQSGQKEVALVISFLEIYCDAIRDLGSAYLAVKGKQSALNAEAARALGLPTGSGSRPPSPKSGEARVVAGRNDGKTHQYAGSSGEENPRFAGATRADEKTSTIFAEARGRALSLSLALSGI